MSALGPCVVLVLVLVVLVVVVVVFLSMKRKGLQSNAGPTKATGQKPGCIMSLASYILYVAI